MRRLRACPRLPAWIAVLAILLAALLPALSHALASEQAGAWVEVCSADGSRWLPADDGPAPGASHTLDHCPCCPHDLPTLGLPPAGVPGLDAPRPAGTARPVAWQPPHGVRAWIGAAPRAPPALA